MNSKPKKYFPRNLFGTYHILDTKLILNLLTVFLLLLPLCIALLAAECKIEKWNELQLTDNYCTTIVNKEIGYLDNHTGILISVDKTTPAFVIDTDKYGDVLSGRKILFPCNLPQENFFHEGQQIKFSGSLISWKGSGSDSIIADAFSIPIILTNAKVKNK